MRLGIKGKQVLYVTSIVGVFVVAVSLLVPGAAGADQPGREPGTRRDACQADLSPRARSRRRGERPIRSASGRSGTAVDARVESVRQNVTFAAIVDTSGRLIAKDPALQDSTLRTAEDLSTLLEQSPFAQLRAIYEGQGRNLEARQPLLVGDAEIRFDPHWRLDASHPG